MLNILRTILLLGLFIVGFIGLSWEIQENKGRGKWTAPITMIAAIIGMVLVWL